MMNFKFEEHETLGLHVVNIDFDNEPCSMILFRNWTNHFKFQFAKEQHQLSDLIAQAVSTDIRDPLQIIISQIQELSDMLKH